MLASSVSNERKPERMSNDFMDGPLLRETGPAKVSSAQCPVLIAPKDQAWLNASQPPSEFATVVKTESAWSGKHQNLGFRQKGVIARSQRVSW
jgi:hypothetical protein